MKDWINGSGGWPIDPISFYCLCCGSLFYPWFKSFSFLFFLSMVMCDSEFERKGNKI